MDVCERNLGSNFRERRHIIDDGLIRFDIVVLVTRYEELTRVHVELVVTLHLKHILVLRCYFRDGNRLGPQR